MPLDSSDRYLFRDILKRVSRSFYLTLAVLPAPVREQIGLAYLLARAADTLADSGQLEDGDRLRLLRELKASIQRGNSETATLRSIDRLISSAGFSRDEQQLLAELGRCLAILQKVHPKDRGYIAEVLGVLIGGMEFDIEKFPRGGEGALHALAEMSEFEFYTYSVAGCVGEFWTNMMCAHLPGFSRWEPVVMVPLGIRFGKGLQMVNILRDMAEDLRKGRCYIPLSLLASSGLKPEDLLDSSCEKKFRPLYRSLLLEAGRHLDQGWRYTMLVPRTQLRVRLACMWPILIGIRTLQRLSVSPDILNPERIVKVSRPEVYRIMGFTGLTGGCGYVGSAYWGYWRKRIV